MGKFGKKYVKTNQVAFSLAHNSASENFRFYLISSVGRRRRHYFLKYSTFFKTFWTIFVFRPT